MKRIVLVVLLVFALVVPTRAQTLTEQLQKGIYTEETLGNRDEAERIYRQILAAPAVPQSISQEAQRRLARLLLARRPPPRALAVPQVPDARQAVTVTARDLELHLAAAQAATGLPEEPLLGAVEQGRYRHFASGITFDVPQGWSAGRTVPSSDNGEMVVLRDGATGLSMQVWLLKEEVPTARLAERVAGAPAEKLRQRHSGYGIPGMADSSSYDIPADTVRLTLINGRQAVAAIGEYRGVPVESVPQGRQRGADEPMKEYMTWIHTEHSRAFFFARVRADDVPQLRPVFEQLVNSAVFE